MQSLFFLIYFSFVVVRFVYNRNIIEFVRRFLLLDYLTHFVLEGEPVRASYFVRVHIALLSALVSVLVRIPPCLPFLNP